MDYLDKTQLKAYCNAGKVIEFWLGIEYLDEYKTYKWMSLEKYNKKYYILLHHVFDEADEGLDSIYDYSYVEPDDIDGKDIFENESFTDIIHFLESNNNIPNNRFMLSGNMDKEMESRQ